MSSILPIEQSDPELSDLLLWYYNSGIRNKNINLDSIPINVPIIKEKEIGRNDLCVCGSGKKYKKCCLIK
jgi:preprotein translocase subunit SecA